MQVHCLVKVETIPAAFISAIGLSTLCTQYWKTISVCLLWLAV